MWIGRSKNILSGKSTFEFFFLLFLPLNRGDIRGLVIRLQKICELLGIRRVLGVFDCLFRQILQQSATQKSTEITFSRTIFNCTSLVQLRYLFHSNFSSDILLFDQCLNEGYKRFIISISVLHPTLPFPPNPLNFRVRRLKAYMACKQLNIREHFQFQLQN